MPVRKAVFAGHGWYPSDRRALVQMLGEFVPERDDVVSATVVVAPHAGYVFSGPVAGAVYARVVVPDDVILLSVNHGHSPGAAVALFDEGRWETPLGDVPIATELVAAIVAECPMVQADPDAHEDEHSGEVHVPFLRYRNEHVRIAPICISRTTRSGAIALGEGLARAAARVTRPVLVVASTDLSHEHPRPAPRGGGFLSGENLAEFVREQDQKVIDRILALDARGVWETVEREGVSMCGYAPVTAAVAYASARGATVGEVVDHRTSVDAPGGRYDYIVGYVGALLR